MTLEFANRDQFEKRVNYCLELFNKESREKELKELHDKRSELVAKIIDDALVKICDNIQQTGKLQQEIYFGSSSLYTQSNAVDSLNELIKIQELLKVDAICLVTHTLLENKLKEFGVNIQSSFSNRYFYKFYINIEKVE
jgi:hypothetical protein